MHVVRSKYVVEEGKEMHAFSNIGKLMKKVENACLDILE